MCFYVDCPKVLKAEEDIKVYKKFEIKEDSENELQVVGAFQGYAYVESYYYKLNKKNHPSTTLGLRAGRNVKLPEINAGMLHSWNCLCAKAYPRKDEFILECYIPKGALYLENVERQEFVSTALFVTNKCLEFHNPSVKSRFEKLNINLK